MATLTMTSSSRESNESAWELPAWCAAVAALTAVLTALTISQALVRYEEFRSGWSWDLAYYNQWFRAFNRGEEITVRPLGPFCAEGPSVWASNYLAPVRLAIAPIHRAFPDPRTLLIVQ